MPYAVRDPEGRIAALTADRPDGPAELLAGDDPEIVAFLFGEAPDRGDILRADLDFIRVLEDLIEVLVEKRLILLTDLPSAAQGKMFSRGRLRQTLRDTAGLVPEEDAQVL